VCGSFVVIEEYHHNRQGFVLTSAADTTYMSTWLDYLNNFTCDGLTVSSVANCVSNHQLCSNAGICTDNACVCNSTRHGQYCEFVVSASSNNALVISLGNAFNVISSSLAET
jgi:hypothetical protein